MRHGAARPTAKHLNNSVMMARRARHRGKRARAKRYFVVAGLRQGCALRLRRAGQALG